MPDGSNLVSPAPEPAFAPLDLFQIDNIQSALARIITATTMLDDLGADIANHCKARAEAERIAFLSETIGMYVAQARAILSAAQQAKTTVSTTGGVNNA